MCEKLVGEDGYRFLECGKEDGADGIDGINYLNCPEWSMDYDEYTNSIGFEDFVDDVVEHKSTEYPDLKTVVIDTYDQLIEIAKPEAILFQSINTYHETFHLSGQQFQLSYPLLFLLFFFLP